MPWKECNLMDVRTEFALQSIRQGVSFNRLCAEYGISRKTGYKWKQRFLSEGMEGLKDRSRKPKHSPGGLAEDVVCEIIRLKQAHKHWGPAKIRDLYLRKHGTGPSLSSCKRVLDRAGLVCHRPKRRIHHPVRICQMKTAEAPNDIWTVDFKGWWQTRQNQRCEPLTVQDAHSRFILCVQAVNSTRTEVIRKEFERLFSLYGLPSIIRSDNGPPFACCRSLLGLSALSAWWITLGIRLDRIRPGHPEENGRHERMHLDIRKELQGMIEGDLDDHQSAFDLWREEYNFQRPHESLGMKRPAEIYRKSSVPWPKQPVQMQYDPPFLTRKVSSNGVIRVEDYPIYLSASLRGWNVGLRYASNAKLEAWFDYLYLGEIDLSTLAFLPSSNEETNINTLKLLPVS